MKIVDLAGKYDVFIVEDDYLGDLTVKKRVPSITLLRCIGAGYIRKKFV